MIVLLPLSSPESKKRVMSSHLPGSWPKHDHIFPWCMLSTWWWKWPHRKLQLHNSPCGESHEIAFTSFTFTESYFPLKGQLQKASKIQNIQTLKVNDIQCSFLARAFSCASSFYWHLGSTATSLHYILMHRYNLTSYIRSPKLWPGNTQCLDPCGFALEGAVWDANFVWKTEW